jgi:hypothetical protein
LFASHHDIVDLLPGCDRGRTALMALFSDAALNLCDRARLGKAIDSETYTSGYGSQLFVDGLDFVLGELAYASVGGVLFWDPRGGG